MLVNDHRHRCAAAAFMMNKPITAPLRICAMAGNLTYMLCNQKTHRVHADDLAELMKANAHRLMKRIHIEQCAIVLDN